MARAKSELRPCGIASGPVAASVHPNLRRSGYLRTEGDRKRCALAVLSPNAQPTTTTETLTGTGTPAPIHTVNLSWTASTSSNIAGYNIYRAVYTSSCGSFSKINSALNTTTLYTDSAVVSGTSYCYAATTVDSTTRKAPTRTSLPTFKFLFRNPNTDESLLWRSVDVG